MNNNSLLLTQEKQSLKSWGLPRKILEKYAAKGIENMFSWQLECLTCDGVLSGKNLIYSAPTSAGKTMVAEILTIQTVLERKKKVMIILPFISVVREKMLYLQNLLGSSGVRVEGFMGSHAPPGGLRTVHIAVCTIEKANSLINRLLEDQGLDAIGCVVVDEIHLLGDPHRGYLLELLLTKLKYMCLKDNSLKIQIVGMSATLPNVSEISSWLDAALYITDFRPIPLIEYLKVDGNVYEAGNPEIKYKIQPITKFKSDPGDVIHLCLEALLDGHSVLVFCPTRAWCETAAQQIAIEFRRIGYEKSDLGLKVREQLDGGAISDVLEQLKRCPAGLDQTLGRSVAFGVAFHHAGLTMDERDIVEGAFRSSILRVLVATSTLSSGVNLPARRVLIRCPPRNMAADILTYRQMVGRAGRMGKDTEGESFLICNGSERRIGEQMVNSTLPSVESSLGVGDLSSSLKRAVLEVIASGVVSTTADVEVYTGCTFLASCAADDSQAELADPLAACVEYLQSNEFIRVTGSSLGPTPLAEACLSASIPPDQGLKLLKELHRARQCFVLETELHVIYQVTPFSVSEQWGEMDWLRVLSLWEDLPVSMKRVGELVGVEERFLVRAVRGTVNSQNSAQKLSIHRRFYTALALQDLVNEVPLPQVAVKYNCSKGMLQSLQQSASTFAGMVTQFSRRLGWSNVELLVSQFCARLQFGAQRELLDLLRLDCLTAVQARALYNAGIQALADLATARVSKIEKALNRATPFQSENEDIGASDKCRIWLVGRCSVTETRAANILIQEARQYLERELGLQNANWGDLNSTNEITDSESPTTQILATPSQSIGRDFVKTLDSKEEKSSEVKQAKAENEEFCGIRHLNKDNSETPVETIVPIEEPNSNSTTNVKEARLETNNVPMNVDNVLVDKSKDISVNSASVTPSATLAVKLETNGKRGSLDLFDSPVQENDNAVNDVNEVNIEENNVKLDSSDVKLVYTSNQDAKHNVSLKNEKNIFKCDDSLKREDLKNQNVSKSKDQSINYEPTNMSSFFFDSPTCNEDVKEDASFYEKLDANVGGESLLEMSSFVVTSEDNDLPDNEINVLDANVRGDSILELSSFLSDVEGRKRKRSLEAENARKKFKVRGVSTSTQIQMDTEDELQVSHITSTANNIKPCKTSTPSLSLYFCEAKKVETPIVFETALPTNSPPIFVEVSKSTEDDIALETSEVNNDGANFSFTLEMSTELSDEGDMFCDSEFNINSKICDILDCDNNSNKKSDESLTPLHHKGSDTPNHLEGDKVDSKLAANLDAQLTVMDTASDARKKYANVQKGIDLQSVHKKLSFSESVNIDSKLEALLDGNESQINCNNDDELLSSTKLECGKNKKVEFCKTEITIDASNNFNLSTQFCAIHDEKATSKKFHSESTNEVVAKSSKTFECSEFDVNTQLCNVLDNYNPSNKDNKKTIMSDTMEVNEIQNLNFDDDTVLGTPVNHHKSISFKNVFSKKVAKLEKKVDNFSIPKEQSNNFFKRRVEENNRCSEREKRIIETTETKQVVEKTNNEKNSTAAAMGNSLTNTILEAAFESSFNLETEDPEDDEVVSSQKPPPTPHGSPQERMQKVNLTNSPSVNKNRSQVKVTRVSVNNKELMAKCVENIKSKKVISLVLTVKELKGTDIGGKIGARFVKKKEEIAFPCHYKGSYVTEAVICTGDHSVFSFNMDENSYKHSLEVLKSVLSRKNLEVCMWQVKLTVKMLLQCCQLQCQTRVSDPTIAEWLLKPHASTPTLKQMARMYSVSAPQCSDESGFHALLVWELSKILKTKLKQAGLYTSYVEIEMPTQLCLVEMEVTGVRWDKEYAELLWTSVEEKMSELQNKLFHLCGKKFNLRSKTDLLKIKRSMKELEETVIIEFDSVLRNWRVLNSLKTRNMSSLMTEEGECILGTWDTHTVTGRVSMLEPSLQHTPRDICIDDQVFSLRSAFIAGEGNTLVSADFCQLELRLLAHFSQDQNLLETFSKPSDVFVAISAEWNNIASEQVTDSIRQRTKQLCYGLIYGMGLRSLAEEMDLEETVAADMVTSFHRTYPGIQSYVNTCVDNCRKAGHVTTIMNRKRFLPDISSRNSAYRAQAERQAVNTTIQGSAADIAKVAMLQVKSKLHQRRLQAHLIIHLHDELIYQVANKDVKQFITVLREGMENAVKLSVPLPVKVKRGPSWGALESID